MAALGKNTKIERVSPLKPGLRGARNWATAQLRSANYSRRGFWRLTLSIMFVVSSILFLGLWLGGFLPDVRRVSGDFTKNRLMSMGFVVDRVDVIGEGRLRETDIRQAVNVQTGDYLFDVDLKMAQERVENLNWVERAVIRRLWPDRIVVQIIERKPYALWQNEGEFHLVDKTGVVISKVNLADYQGYPLLVGMTAPDKFFDFKQTVQGFKNINKRVSTYVYHNTGRWDLITNDGEIRVKLPETAPYNALTHLKKLQETTRILDREVSIIDLRLPDRITLSPSNPEPA